MVLIFEYGLVVCTYFVYLNILATDVSWIIYSFFVGLLDVAEGLINFSFLIE
jgi:hypothetical protein